MVVHHLSQKVHQEDLLRRLSEELDAVKVAEVPVEKKEEPVKVEKPAKKSKKNVEDEPAPVKKQSLEDAFDEIMNEEE
jgi:hypothetical protein